MARGDGYRKHQLDLCREKIKTTQLLKRLQDNGLADKDFLTTNQIRSIEIVLAKSLPNLASVEHTGDNPIQYVIHAPLPNKTAEEWEQENQTVQ